LGKVKWVHSSCCYKHGNQPVSGRDNRHHMLQMLRIMQATEL